MLKNFWLVMQFSCEIVKPKGHLYMKLSSSGYLYQGRIIQFASVFSVKVGILCYWLSHNVLKYIFSQCKHGLECKRSYAFRLGWIFIFSATHVTLFLTSEEQIQKQQFSARTNPSRWQESNLFECPRSPSNVRVGVLQPFFH